MSSATAVRRPVEPRNSTVATRRVPSRVRPRLASVAPTPVRPHRAPFVGLIVLLLTGGSLALLLLNTALAQGAFSQTDLQRKVAILSDQEQVLQERVAQLSTPRRIAARARAMGMVMTVNPVFLRSSDHKVLGVAHPAAGVLPGGAATGMSQGWTPPAAGVGQTTLSPGTTSGPGRGVATTAARQPHAGGTTAQTSSSGGSSQHHGTTRTHTPTR